jgi:predicted ATP-dependent endonuclease of OLD family
MIIEKVTIVNYKSFKGFFELPVNPVLSIIVGDNEAGKSSILEAIHLGLTGQLHGKSIHNEISPYWFNNEVVNEYLRKLYAGETAPLPVIKIEIFLKPHDDLADFRGTNNSAKADVPGFYVEIKFDEAFTAEYQEYIKEPNEKIRTLPVEYYDARWYSFANEAVTSRSIPINACLIDTTTTKLANGADIYIAKIIREHLEPKERANLAVNHRVLKETFATSESIRAINTKLQKKNGMVTDKTLTLCVDVSSKTNWETTLTAHLDDIPFHFIGKGEQNAIKMKLALEHNANKKCNIILVEEPENHLSHSNMNKLINNISERCDGKQLIMATHSSYVLNKLGLENLILLNANKKIATLKSLSGETQKYFKKLPGYDTLRILLSPKAILVEGPSDELIVQRAYLQKYKKLPVELGVDVITIRGLSFKRFLEIAKVLHKEITVITDNDGKARTDIEASYRELLGVSIVYFDDDVTYKTLEPQIVKCNSLDLLNEILDKSFTDKQTLKDFMINNKTETALKILESKKDIVIPKYIEDAI